VTVDADFTFTDYPVNTAPWDVPQVLLHEVIEALARLLGRDLELTHGGAYFGSLLLGHINLGVRHCFYNSLASILRWPSLPPGKDASMVGGLRSGFARGRRMLVDLPIEAIVLGRQDRASRVESLAPKSRRDPCQRRSVEFTEGFPAHRPPEAGIDVNNETRAPLLLFRNLRYRGAPPARPPAACLPAPLSIEGAHEKNARECNSGGRVARRSG
jgi:hypothetical protein